MFGLVLIACWIVLLIAAALIVSAYRRHRLATVDQRAQRLGFFFDDNSSPFQGSEVHGLSVLRCDPGAIVSQMMTGKIGGSPAAIFNLICYGQHCKSVNAVTVAAFRSPIGRLPLFRIGAKEVLHGLAMRIGGEDLNSQGEREFGKHCLLQCAAKDNDRFFTSSKLLELESHAKNLCIESSDDWVFAYRPCTRLKLEAWPEFIVEASAISDILFGTGSLGTVEPKAHAAAAGI